MANRIPPSLKWLIDKRARIAGEIHKARRAINKAQALIMDFDDLELKLRAIDTTLELHEIKIDINLIEPIESKDIRINLPHGELTKSILMCIKIYGENGPVSKATIVDFIIARHYDFEADKIPASEIKNSIKKRLNTLYHQGYIIRHHDQKTSDYGCWSISPEYVF